MNIIFNSALFVLCIFAKAAEDSVLPLIKGVKHSFVQLIIPSKIPDYFRNHSSLHFTNYQNDSLVFELTDRGSYTEFKYFFDGKSVPASFTSETNKSLAASLKNAFSKKERVT